MQIWFDTEFIEDGETIDLISIGAVRDDGVTYYAELAGVHWDKANQFVLDNVVPHLHRNVKPRKFVAAEFQEFAGTSPVLWAYYADYDWVALCQLYGRMVDLPDGWPMYCRDIKQFADHMNVRDLHTIPQEKEHHALADAQWNRRAWWHVASANSVTPER